jgi:hypothetical protein
LDFLEHLNMAVSEGDVAKPNLTLKRLPLAKPQDAKYPAVFCESVESCVLHHKLKAKVIDRQEQKCVVPY